MQIYFPYITLVYYTIAISIAAIADNFPNTKSGWYSGKRAFTRAVGDAVDVVNIFIPQGFDSVAASLPARRNEAITLIVLPSVVGLFTKPSW